MKTQSNHIPETILPLGGGMFHFNYNVVEVTDEETLRYEYDTIELSTEPNYENIVNALIRQQYSGSSELAILRQREEKPEEFTEYNAFCEQCKLIAAVVK